MATAADDIRPTQNTGSSNTTGTIAQIIGAVVDRAFPGQSAGDPLGARDG